MKQILLTLLVSFVGFTSLQAQSSYTGDGYYRVKNVNTERYVTVIDGYGKVDVQSTSADMGAIETVRDFENIVSDPASIIYIKQEGGGYNLFCQGVETYKMIHYYFHIGYVKRLDAYQVSASSAGLTLSLSDTEKPGSVKSVVNTKDNLINWYIQALSQEDNYYFGIDPDITIGSTYYKSFYASFPYSFASEGMKAYYVTMVDPVLKAAVWKEVSTRDVPAAMPVFIQCSAKGAASNKFDIHDSKETIPSDMSADMKGVYFLRDRSQKTNPHRFVTENDTATMRILGKTTDGSIGLVKCKDQFIPKNTAYVVVPAGSPKEFKLMTQEEYDKIPRTTLVTKITLDKSEASLAIGETLQLTATLLPEEATDKSVTWSSSDEKVATVTAEGLVTATGKGEAVITARTADGSELTATCKVTTYSTLAESISLDTESTELTIGESVKLIATVLPETTLNKSVTWSSSDPHVASVSEDGTVTAIGVGTAIITATTADGTSLSATCEITVYPVYVTSITLNYTEYAIDVTKPKTLQLTATILPGNATDTSLTWDTSDGTVATVTNNGFVTIWKAGYALITVTANDGSGCEAECLITATNDIEDLRTGISADAPAFNLSGQAVNATYHGVVIRNGKKTLQ